MPRRELTKLLSLLCTLSEGLQELLEHPETLERIILRKGETLLMPGMDALKAYFIYKGACKFLWKNEDNEEEIFQFGREGEIVLLWDAFFLGLTNVDVYVIAVEDIELYAITKKQMDEIYANYPEARMLTEKIHKEIWDKWVQYIRILREKEIDRYALFTKLFPELQGRLSNKDVQSFLALGKTTLNKSLNRLLNALRRKTGLWCSYLNILWFACELF